MSQYKAIPQPGDQRNVSQNDILTNFAYLNNANGAADSGILPVDHLSTGDNVAVPKNGFHEQVSLINRATPANLVNSVNSQASDSILYSHLGGAKAQLQFKYGAGGSQDVQLSDCRAAICFNGSSLAIIGNAFNATVVRTPAGHAAGDYQITMAEAQPNAFYMVFLSTEGNTPRLAMCNTKLNNMFNVTVNSFTGQFSDPSSVSVYVVGLY